MSLLFETWIISAGMALLSGLPLFSRTIRSYSKLCFLLGTGALSGILFFDLLPDLYEMGGAKSLWGVGAVWALYSLFHLTSLGHHEHLPEAAETGHSHDRGVAFFLASMSAHCLASGVLLVASEQLAPAINRTVFLALLSHKAYEALTVSSVLMERQKSRSQALLSIALYAISLPLGVVMTYAFRSVLTPGVALVATSLAAGTLLGCLIFDFFLPSLGYLKRRKRDFAWIAAGFAMTQILMRAV
jgi:zinc transporter ZupT